MGGHKPRLQHRTRTMLNTKSILMICVCITLTRGMHDKNVVSCAGCGGPTRNGHCPNDNCRTQFACNLCGYDKDLKCARAGLCHPPEGETRDSVTTHLENLKDD